MIKTVLDRDEMRKVAPGLVEEFESGPVDAMPLPAFVLAWTVAPGGQSVPGPGEQDADELRAWAERALTFQARGYAPGRKGSYRRPRNGFVIPDAVVDHVRLLSDAEFRIDPNPATLMPRVCRAIEKGLPPPEPDYEPSLPAPRP